MKSKPPLLPPPTASSSPWLSSLLGNAPPPHSLRDVSLFVRRSPSIIQFIVPLPRVIYCLTTRLPYTCILTITQRSIPCLVQSSAHPSITRGRYSPMRLRTTGRRGKRGTCNRIGTRCCCMGVRKTRLGSDHPSPGWLTGDPLPG